MISRSSLIRALMCAIVLGTASAYAADEDWTRYRGALRNAGGAQYYSFDGIGDTGPAVPNEWADGEFLRGAAQEPAQYETVDGPAEGTQAVRLDAAPLTGPAPDIGDQGFTIAAWIRVQGAGSVRGAPVVHGGTLFSVGSGYWDGWRVTLKPDELNAVGFEVGRPKPDHAAFLQGGHLLTGVWHHLAASWDGQTMRVFIDGVLSAEQPHAFPYAQPSNGAFRVGLAGHGWGSSVFDVADIALYERALSMADIMRAACLHAPLTQEQATDFEKAWELAKGGDTTGAVAAFDAIARQPVAPCYAGMALAQASVLLRREGESAEAAQRLRAILMREGVSSFMRTHALQALVDLLQDVDVTLPAESYEAALDSGEIPEAARKGLRLNLAQALLAKGEFSKAEPILRQALAESDMTPRARGELMLDLAHGSRAQGRQDDARSLYRQIVDWPDAPVGFSSYAQLCVAQTFLDMKNWEDARASLSALADDEQAPRHHRQEARERALEVTRLEKGLPAFNPDVSRTPAPQWPAPGMTYFVAPGGKPENPGTKEAPFGDLRAARDAVRRLKRDQGLPEGGVVVRVAAGVYPVTETLELTSEDSGTAEAPVIYRAEEAGTVRLSGGLSLKGFEPVSDASVRARLPEEARGRVFEVDLGAFGVTDYGVVRSYGHAIEEERGILELFFAGNAMRMARWPNEGYLRTGTVHDVGAASPERGAVFDCDEERLARWGEARDAWIFGFPRYLWADASLPVRAIDAEARRITLGAFYGYGGGMKADMPFYFFNLLEEIDQPGEYYLDRETGLLYFYPPGDLAASAAEVSLLPVPFVAMKDASHVVFEGFVFELGQTHAVTIQGGAHNLIAGCALRKLGGNGVVIDGGSNHRVVGCDLEVLGMGGVRINAGDRATLTRCDHLVENCHVYDFSRIKRTYTPAVWLDGVGSSVIHNEFHHSPCHAIRMNGNEHTIEFNNVYDVLLESDDQGGLDAWFDPTHRGNVIRFNYWHDMGGNGFPCGQAGVRLDDAISETVVFGNVFRRCSHGHFGGVQIHGGKENFIENNIFVDCASAISFSHWGEKRWADFLQSERVIEATTKNVNIHEPPYSTRYPALAHLADNPNINRVWRNIVYRCDEFLARDNGRQELMDNLLTQEDPGFVDADGGDFTLKPDAAALGLTGFRPIPFGAIGLYEDKLRKHLP